MLHFSAAQKFYSFSRAEKLKVSLLTVTSTCWLGLWQGMNKDSQGGYSPVKKRIGWCKKLGYFLYEGRRETSLTILKMPELAKTTTEFFGWKSL